VVTICTASLTFNNSAFYPHTVFMCFVWISEQTAIISLYSINWLVFRRVRKNCDKRLSASSCLSVCPHGTFQLPPDRFSWYLISEYFPKNKTVEKIQVSLQPANNNRYCTFRPIHIFYHISLVSVGKEKCFRQRFRENQNIHFVFTKFFFPENRAVYKIIWKKNIVERGRPQMACAMHAGYLRLQTHTHNMHYILLSHYNNGCTNALLSHVICTVQYIGCIVMTEKECVYCAVRIELLNVIKVNIILLHVNRISSVCKSCNIAVLHKEESTFRH